MADVSGAVGLAYAGIMGVVKRGHGFHNPMVKCLATHPGGDVCKHLLASEAVVADPHRQLVCVEEQRDGLVPAVEQDTVGCGRGEGGRGVGNKRKRRVHALRAACKLEVSHPDTHICLPDYAAWG